MPSAPGDVFPVLRRPYFASAREIYCSKGISSGCSSSDFHGSSISSVEVLLASLLWPSTRALSILVEYMLSSNWIGGGASRCRGLSQRVARYTSPGLVISEMILRQKSLLTRRTVRLKSTRALCVSSPVADSVALHIARRPVSAPEHSLVHHGHARAWFYRNAELSELLQGWSQPAIITT